MTTWDDLTDDDDDLVVDVLARPRAEEPPAAVPQDRPVSVHDPLADEPVIDEGGFSDPSGSVTVWVDEAYEVIRVRISTRWRHASPQPLAQRLLFAAQAATMAKLYAEPAQDRGGDLGEGPRFEPVPLDEISFDERELADLREEGLQLGERLDALDARDDVRPTIVRYEQARGRSANQMVTVSLDQQRRPNAVDLDERWLAGARTENIIEAVTEACTSAYAQWREPDIEPGEYAEIVDRLAELRRRMLEPVLLAGGWIDPREVL